MKKFEEKLRTLKEKTLKLDWSPGIRFWYDLSTLVNVFGDWISPEDYVKLRDDFDCADERVKFLESTVDDLKSQLEKQQPEIPEFMAKAVEEFKKKPDSYKGFSNVNEVWSWLNEYQMNNDDFGICGLNNKFFVLAHFAINGYTVAKEKRFYLKHIDMSKKYNSNVCVLAHGEGDVIYGHCDFPVGVFPSDNEFKFTQSQIDSMETGSYQQIEVEE
ncbi:DUF1642 domain-containing protein [Lactococcus garvieae]|uniref:DUF1642 domain-containing protein n=1 Tax=Lactococcus garvieae TaxID=1363 RepID=UPI00398EFCC6